ncbi:sigma-54-dependent transcriptional regulator [Pseudomonas chlororaphis subsp. aurantiaca]|jgi:transcriptional regulator with AAA-type ATPase domain|uniref:Sigma-54-dependent Fis family transcriptional regulator n=2 Tax=Pseudomonas chlororaphis TaxID=587753 RepID=A0AAJ0ZNS7_9PSED|nr:MULTISPECIES: sigma-54 dependent transcriptional regulator [Pseudomonas]AIS15628.1 Fis family transcriptional regulator [Pseudomonas chlororaphis subsp. aurantiaca]AZD19579.1 sigma-54-dependent transcriptional regulator [Pseudomonas chlororaphis subsp. aurantiaca]AZD33027.1 sigma-54-dependent transcriptional regulator [Pseudomonas chlororaphis subsp. aurantiaca]AZD39357.1 sigma-54-dependent transcriptional regulator [Pseudomonas chlororaphis subsp. aurantiaca]AZD45696.1 sigma-54-dependent t
MSLHESFGQPLLTFPDAEKSPLSIRAKALVFVDPRSRQLRQELEQLAPRAISVLIRGETGSGKELLARHIHRASDRSGLFVSVNCGAISPTYADAELFGYAGGAFSGSASSRAGWFGSANGGTLYLDEIGDLPLPIQIKLLSALENHEVTRVGAHQPSPVDVRLVAATSIDLAQAVAAGKFHERLYHYLGEGHLELPALRERVGDILSLAEYFLGIYSQRLDLPVPLISEAAQQVLEQHSWPGNTRELENVIHFALLVSSGEEILPEHLNLPPQLSRLERVDQQLKGLIADGSAAELQALKHLLKQHGVI